MKSVMVLVFIMFLVLVIPAKAWDTTCENGKSVNIVAHEDDDLLFMNPAPI